MAKTPTNRVSLFAVVRTADYQAGFAHLKVQPTIVGVYLNLERAEEIAGRYAQEMKDKGINGFNFEVTAATYYDD